MFIVDVALTLKGILIFENGGHVKNMWNCGLYLPKFKRF